MRIEATTRCFRVDRGLAAGFETQFAETSVVFVKLSFRRIQYQQLSIAKRFQRSKRPRAVGPY